MDKDEFQMVGKPKSNVETGPEVISVHNSFDALLAEVDVNATVGLRGCNDEQGMLQADVLVDKGQEVIPPTLDG